MSIIAVYPGTFDPITKGHEDLVKRTSIMFSQVIVGVAESPKKQTLFSLEERVNLASCILSEYGNVSVVPFTGLLVDFADKHKASVVVRGIRTVSDFDFELQLASMNRSLAPEVETVFLTPKEKYAFVSSTLIREVAQLHGKVNHLVHPLVAEALSERFATTS